MKVAKRFASIAVIIAAAILLLVACSDNSSANQKDTQITDQQFGIYSQAQPVHIYDYSVPRDVFQQIYDATMTAHNTWSVWYSNDHIPLDSCPSIGYPIAGGTQLTNPQRTATNGNSTGVVTLPQGEPNGLFPPTTSVGTWVLCIHNDKTEPTYVEPNVVTYSHPVRIEGDKVVDAGGPSSVTVNVRQAPPNLVTTTPAATAHP